MAKLTSDMILDAQEDAGLRERLTALRPNGVTEQQIWERMNELVRAEVTDSGDTIASVYRYALGQGGKRAGGHRDYVTDEHLSSALGKVFPQGA